MRGQSTYQDFTDATPVDRLRLAAWAIHKASIEPDLRTLAVNILKGKPPFGRSRRARNVFRDGPKIFADWIRSSFTYAQEAPGIEILQGPRTSLRVRVLDCDDAAILWATLMRLVGLEGDLVGVAKASTPWIYYHAVGLDRRTGKLYELSMDGWYGGVGHRSRSFRVPPGSVTVFYDPATQTYYISQGNEQSYHAISHEQLEGAKRMPRYYNMTGANIMNGANVQQAGDIYWGPNPVQLTGRAGPGDLMGATGQAGDIYYAPPMGKKPGTDPDTGGDAWTHEETGGVIEQVGGWVNAWITGDQPGDVTNVYQTGEAEEQGPPVQQAGMSTGMMMTIGVVALLGVGALVMMGRK